MTMEPYSCSMDPPPAASSFAPAADRSSTMDRNIHSEGEEPLSTWAFRRFDCSSTDLRYWLVAGAGRCQRRRRDRWAWSDERRRVPL